MWEVEGEDMSAFTHIRCVCGGGMWEVEGEDMSAFTHMVVSSNI